MDKKESMEDRLPHEKAWEHFWKNKHNFPEWKNKTRAEKAPAYMAQKSWKDKDKTLTPSRTETLLRRYAPERYNFELVITINEETK